MSSPRSDYLPIVFHPKYDIFLFGAEHFHPFDTAKYGRVYKELKRHKKLKIQFHRPKMLKQRDMKRVHTEKYLRSLKDSKVLSKIIEMPPLSILPNFVLQQLFVKPMKYGAGGTVSAAQLAMKQGWAVNLSGGYHHAKAQKGEGFCVFADISIAIEVLRTDRPNLRVLLVDLDAHQGNGLASIKKECSLTFLFDMYNRNIYPQDIRALKYIDFDHPLAPRTEDKEYLTILRDSLPKAIQKTKPQLIIYNAGTDIYEYDSLGGLSVSRAGIMERDEFLFDTAAEREIPILQVLSGGYTPQSAGIIAASIENIVSKSR